LSKRTLVFAVVAAVALGAGVTIPSAGAASAAQTKLIGTVGPGFRIALQQEGTGERVTELAPGTYEIEVHDQSDIHNFHLTGPGVNQKTELDFIGTVTWTVTVTDGAYTYVCDAHPNIMRGSFRVGTVQPPPPPPPPPAPKGLAKGRKLKGSVGPGFTIKLKDAAGKAVKRVKAGTKYTIAVSDRSRLHNFHLLGPGVNKKTAVRAKTKVTWKLKFKKGTYRFRCDPHRTIMKGRFKAL
jgi:plastocyanin